MPAWDELLEEFRALGGTAENIRLGQGEYGRGLFPIDPTKPIAIHIPDNLLVATEDMVIERGIPRVSPNAKANDREKAWLDRYQKEFAWGGGGVDEIRGIFEMAAQLSEELRDKLLTEYNCGRWFEQPSDELIAIQFFGARSIGVGGRATVMPIIDMANHGAGANYDLRSGVALRGTFSGEVVAEYAEFDSHDYFLTWGFATQRPVAFSVALTGKIDATTMEIEQLFEDVAEPPRAWIPKIDKTADKIRLPFVLLGSNKMPRVPKGIFYRSMRDLGFKGVEEAFDLIHHTNRLHFLNLLMDLDGIDLPIARTLRAMAHYQLRAMSFCYGAREVQPESRKAGFAQTPGFLSITVPHPRG